MSYTKDDTDLKKLKKCKKSPKPVMKSADLKKGLWNVSNDDWPGKFFGTEMQVEALKLAKEARQLQRKREGTYDSQVPFSKLENMTRVERAKLEEKQDKERDALRAQEKSITDRAAKLEDKLLDHKIAQAEVDAKAKKMSKSDDVEKSGGRQIKHNGHIIYDTKGGFGVMSRSQYQSKKPLTMNRRYKTIKAAKVAINTALKHVKKSIDVDMDTGHFGTNETGQVSMHVKPNSKCNGCHHYADQLVACSIGLLPAVCGDGSFPEVGYYPLVSDYEAAANFKVLHSEEVAMPAQAGENPVIQEFPYRIEALGKSMHSVAERMALVEKAMSPEALAGHIWYHRVSPEKRLAIYARHDKHAITQKVKQHGGRRKAKAALAAGKHRPPKKWFHDMVARLSTRKSNVWYHPKIMAAVSELSGEELYIPVVKSVVSDGNSLHDFANVVGTTIDVVQDLARRMGNKADFARFIKSKLPDIMMAHGLDEAAMGAIYRSAMRVVKGLSDHQWEAWKGFEFGDSPSDESIANAINANGGLLDDNVSNKSVMLSEHPSELPPPEPIQIPYQEPINTAGFVGGSQSIADILPPV